MRDGATSACDLIRPLGGVTLTYFLSSRREMMPILSLIFSALFILFGTVIIQAFRSGGHHLVLVRDILIAFIATFVISEIVAVSVLTDGFSLCGVFLYFLFSVSQLRTNPGSQSQRSSPKLRLMLRAEQALQGSVRWIPSSVRADSILRTLLPTVLVSKKGYSSSPCSRSCCGA